MDDFEVGILLWITYLKMDGTKVKPTTNKTDPIRLSYSFLSDQRIQTGIKVHYWTTTMTTINF